MRLFAALPMPAAVRSALAERMADLKRNDWPVRWVRSDRLHLTLKFYGETPVHQVESLGAALEPTVDGIGPIAGAVTGLDTLPGGRRARVVFAAVDAPPALEVLAHRIEEASKPLGFVPEGRPFRPHITLARVRHGSHLPTTAGATLASRSLDLPFLLERMELYESRAGADGPDYIPVHTFTLVG
ncbi:MAG TPA: RNA 2',3'-cyclic phosphodiesterase [Gemmatimonadales bacterium]|nr:RNA 2',3'-cyclic phosphodiesterase [Gemmatimonadales bacterium]